LFKECTVIGPHLTSTASKLEMHMPPQIGLIDEHGHSNIKIQEKNIIMLMYKGTNYKVCFH
jgi:hypothetical protein